MARPPAGERRDWQAAQLADGRGWHSGGLACALLRRNPPPTSRVCLAGGTSPRASRVLGAGSSPRDCLEGGGGAPCRVGRLRLGDGHPPYSASSVHLLGVCGRCGTVYVDVISGRCGTVCVEVKRRPSHRHAPIRRTTAAPPATPAVRTRRPSHSTQTVPCRTRGQAPYAPERICLEWGGPRNSEREVIEMSTTTTQNRLLSAAYDNPVIEAEGPKSNPGELANWPMLRISYRNRQGSHRLLAASRARARRPAAGLRHVLQPADPERARVRDRDQCRRRPQGHGG